MKILQVTNYFKPFWAAGGVARASYEISRGLVESGHDVTVFTTNYHRKKAEVRKNRPTQVDGITVYYFDNLKGYTSLKIEPLPYYVPVVLFKSPRFDVIHIHEHRTVLAICSYVYARKNKVPYVIQSHGSVTPVFQKLRVKKVFDNLIGSRILKNASKVIALTSMEAEQYVMMGVDRDKVVIIPNGIDLEDFAELPAKGTFKRKYGIRAEQKVILFLGRINKIKGVDILVRSYSEALKKNGDLILAIVGPGSELSGEIDQLIDQLGLKDRIIFTGPLYDRDKLSAYIDADLYVLPSRYETFPVTVLEAWACGVPVLTTDNCGISDLIDNKAGIVTQLDEKALTDKILQFFNGCYDNELFVNNGKKYVRSTFNLKSVIGQIEGLYSEVIKK